MSWFWLVILETPAANLIHQHLQEVGQHLFDNDGGSLLQTGYFVFKCFNVLIWPSMTTSDG